MNNHVRSCQNSRQAVSGKGQNGGGKKIMRSSKTKDKTIGGSPSKKGILSGVPSSVDHSLIQDTDKSGLF